VSRALFGLLALILVLAPIATTAKEVTVGGYGFFDNRRLAGFLRELADPESSAFTAAFVEEGFFLLNARLASDGYLRPSLRATLTLADGTRRTVEWKGASERSVGEESAIKEVRFIIEEGVHYTFEEVDFIGLTALEEDEAAGYFYADGFLLSFGATRTYSPDVLRRGANSLEQRLRSLGHRDAAVTVEERSVDHQTGGVHVAVRVEEGPRFRLVEIEERLAEGVEDAFAASLLGSSRDRDAIYHQRAVEDASSALRARFYEHGFPDATVETTETELQGGEAAEVVDMRVELRLRPGTRVRLGEVRFEGNEDTSEAFLARKTGLRGDDWLDRTEVQEARYRLGRLGVFSTLSTSIVETDESGVRDVVFDLEEGVRWELNLLAGWGSYEMLRLGFEARHRNLWGRAHQSAFQVLQSFKSTEAEFRYRIPELYNFPASARSTARFLRREEVSFTRQEWYAEVGLDWRVRDWKSRFGITYRLQLLEAREVASDLIERPDQSRAGALLLRHRYDGRDGAVAPQRGFLVDTELELAAGYLGSEVDYQRFDVAASYHHTFREGLYLHLGLRHKALVSSGADRDLLPLNKRFFPGGEHSIRGYTDGRAAPLDEDGTPIGAETMTLLNLEVEVSLTPNLRLVLFGDSLLESFSIDDYPGDTDLHSAGIGLRYNTPLGPLRLEYGYNLNPRPEDSTGALHFSLGFPF
jgi:outer membrane protein insertion porin family